MLDGGDVVFEIIKTDPIQVDSGQLGYSIGQL